MRGGVSELQSPCFTAVRAEIALMSGSVSAGPITWHRARAGVATAGIMRWPNRSTVH